MLHTRCVLGSLHSRLWIIAGCADHVEGEDELASAPPPLWKRLLISLSTTAMGLATAACALSSSGTNGTWSSTHPVE